MKLIFLIASTLLALFGLIGNTQSLCVPRTTVSAFNALQFSGSWFAYQLALKNDSGLIEMPLCARYNFLHVNNGNMVSNFTSFSFSENRFKSIGRVLVYTPGGSGLLTEVLNPIPVSPPPAIGNVNFQVLLTDYSNYAFLDICQNINGIAEEFVVLLVRSLASPEITTFPILGTVFNTFFGLTGYTGGSLRYVYQDSGLCSGI